MPQDEGEHPGAGRVGSVRTLSTRFFPQIHCPAPLGGGAERPVDLPLEASSRHLLYEPTPGVGNYLALKGHSGF